MEGPWAALLSADAEMVDIAHRVGINAVGQVYQDSATPRGIATWWTEDAVGDQHPNGTLHLRFTTNGEERGVMQMKLLEPQPDALVL